MKSEPVDPTHNDDSQEGPALSYGKLSLLLAGALILIVVLMNVLTPEEIPVSEQGFQGLVEGGLVESIVVGDHWLSCVLVREAAVEEQTSVGTRPRRGRRVSINLRVPPPPAQRRQWRDEGIDVRLADAEETATRERQQWTGWALMAALLGVGLYYVVSQARSSKRHDSPRSRLKQLDLALKQGKISREDYDRQAGAISAEL